MLSLLEFRITMSMYKEDGAFCRFAAVYNYIIVFFIIQLSDKEATCVVRTLVHLHNLSQWYSTI